MADREGIIDKIRKLLAIANKNSGATEAEMSTALNMASILMLKHQIGEDQVKAKDDKANIEQLTVDAILRQRWHETTAMIAAKLNFCSALRSTSGKGGADVRFTFVGRPDAVDAAALMFAHLMSEIERLYKQQSRRGVKQRDVKKYRENFKWACSLRVSVRADEMLEQLRNNDAKALEYTGSRALVVASTIDQRLNEIAEWMEKEQIGERSTRKSADWSELGFADGFRSGDLVKVRDEVSDDEAA